MMKGSTKRKSRYFTLSAVTIRPGPSDAMKASNINAGTVTIRQLGVNWKNTIMAPNLWNEIKKSPSETTVAPAGLVKRGELTFDTKYPFAIRLSPALLTD